MSHNPMNGGIDPAFIRKHETHILRLCRVPDGKPRDIRARSYLAALKRHDRTGCQHTVCGLLPSRQDDN